MTEPTSPLVSVVLTTNRNGLYLTATLASLTAQSWTDWELILVDDGSPDGDGIEAAAAQVPNAVVVHQANAGIGVARNVGIARSTGAYLAFLDDDDLWEPERLALQVAALHDHDDAVAAYCQWDFIDERGELMAEGDLEPGGLRSFLRLDSRAPIPTLLIRRRSLDRVGTFHPMLPPGEDLDLIYRLARDGKFVFVPTVLVHYRRHGGNETNDARGAALASVRALWIQQWWSTRRGETDLLEDIRTGLRRTRGYWTEQLVHDSAHQLRQGNLSAAGRYAAFVARHEPALGIKALAHLTRRANR
jgi:glycosyltransferase involved in cell wall biosynthesis